MREYTDAVRSDAVGDDYMVVGGSVACRNCALDFFIEEFTGPGDWVPYRSHATMLIAAISADCAAGHPVTRFRCDGTWAAPAE